MTSPLVDALVALQLFVVLFIALHDWVPLGPLNDVRAVRSADPTGKLVAVTVLSALPFAVGLVASAIHAGQPALPRWLLWWLWISYGSATYGLLRAWWIPYLLLPDPVRAARYQQMFSRTHSFLPLRNGLRPDTLHVALHLVIAAILVLLAAISWKH
jgi:hypothetical protein